MKAIVGQRLDELFRQLVGREVRVEEINDVNIVFKLDDGRRIVVSPNSNGFCHWLDFYEDSG